MSGRRPRLQVTQLVERDDPTSDRDIKAAWAREIDRRKAGRGLVVAEADPENQRVMRAATKAHE